MGYRITTYGALKANLSAAGTTVGLCRAAISRLPLSDEERAETIERLRKQMGDLDAMILELNRPGESWASRLSGRAAEKRPRHAATRSCRQRTVTA